MEGIKEEKGITLIALIITIIVMLILVMVTISFAMNGGLFKRANEGSTETEKHVIYDIIKGSMVLEKDGDATFQVGEIRVYDTEKAAEDALVDAGYARSKISAVFSNGLTNETSKKAIMTVEGKLGTWKYKITTTEIVIYSEDEEDSGGGTDADEQALLDELKDYILGPEDEGGNRPGRNLFAIIDEDTFQFKHAEDDVNPTTYQNLKFSNYMIANGEPVEGMFIRYAGDIYSFGFEVVQVDNEEVYLTNSLELVTDNPGNLGKYVQFKNDDSHRNWIVFNENETTVELIAADALAEFTIGNDDNFEESRLEYNNAIALLVEACDMQLKNSNDQYISSSIQSVRSVGGPLQDNTTTYFDFLDFYTTNFHNESYTSSDFEAVNNKFLAGDTDGYLADLNKMDSLAIRATDNMGNYFFASRSATGGSTSGHPVFGLREIIYGLQLQDAREVCKVMYYSNEFHNYSGEYTSGTRPVVTITKSALDNATGTGLTNNPFIID